MEKFNNAYAIEGTPPFEWAAELACIEMGAFEQCLAYEDFESADRASELQFGFRLFAFDPTNLWVFKGEQA